jgi:hypothetical protein
MDNFLAEKLSFLLVSVEVNAPIEFTVTSADGIDLTAQATIYDKSHDYVVVENPFTPTRDTLQNKSEQIRNPFALGVMGLSLCFNYYWCSGRSRSCTTFTGENVEMGTSTKMVFQFAIAPFQRPGNS